MSRFTFYSYIVFAVLMIALGITILSAYLKNPNVGLSSYDGLQQVQGRVEWVEPYKFGVRFGLIGDDRGFAYLSKADATPLVTQSLLNAGDHVITVLAELDDAHTPLNSDKEYHVVFQVVIGEKMVRSYQEVTDAWVRDNHLMLLVGTLFLLSGGYVGWRAYVKSQLPNR